MLASQCITKHASGTNCPARPRRRGAAVVELAVTVPLLTVLALGVVEYAQLTHASQVVSNASRRGARYAARSETTSAASVDTYIKNYITGSFNNLSAAGGNSAITVSVLDGVGAPIGDLGSTATGVPLSVDVSFDFESIRLLSYFSVLNNTTLQTSATVRRE